MLSAGNEGYTLMPSAMKTKPRKSHTALGQVNSEAPHSFHGVIIVPLACHECFSIFFFMPTHLSKHSGHGKGISFLKAVVMLCQTLCQKTFKLGSCFQICRCRIFWDSRVPGVSQLQVKCIGLWGQHFKMTKGRFESVL